MTSLMPLRMMNHDAETDESIARRVQEGETSLYRQLVERYQERLLRYAAYYCKDPDDAADIVQEAFVKAYVNLRGFNTKKRFSSWIYRIVHNEALNGLKKARRSISLDEHTWVEQIADTRRNSLRDLQDEEIQQAVRDCLNALPIAYRIPLTLYYLEEHSYTEISEILHIPIGTVGTRITRGRMLVKRLWVKKEATP